VKVGGAGMTKVTLACADGQSPSKHGVAVMVAVPTVEDFIVTEQ